MPLPWPKWMESPSSVPKMFFWHASSVLHPPLPHKYHTVPYQVFNNIHYKTCPSGLWLIVHTMCSLCIILLGIFAYVCKTPCLHSATNAATQTSPSWKKNVAVEGKVHYRTMSFTKSTKQDLHCSERNNDVIHLNSISPNLTQNSLLLI